MLIDILIVVAVIVVLFIIFVATRPADFTTTRTQLMDAPPGAPFEQVNNFHNWDAWSPWAKMDPTMKKTYDGSPAGVGAMYAWEGNSKVGSGKMNITESQPGQRVVINLAFQKPFKANNTAVFKFEPRDGQTSVTWSMSGKKNFLFKMFGLIMNMDDMVGKDFAKGLASMKSIVESK